MILPIKNLFNYALIIFILFFMLILPLLVDAHGTGQTITIDYENYQIDIDLDNPEPKAGDSVRFDFDILNSDGLDIDTDFDYVWVRIQNNQKIIFAGGLAKPSFGPTGLTTTLPDNGQYQISLRFEMEGEKIIEGATTFAVAKSEKGNKGGFPSFLFTYHFIGGILLGLVLRFLFEQVWKK